MFYHYNIRQCHTNGDVTLFALGSVVHREVCSKMHSNRPNAARSLSRLAIARESVVLVGRRVV